jgi:hypothetical protein
MKRIVLARTGRTILAAAVAAVAVAALAAPALAWYSRYVSEAIFAPGSSVGSAFNSLTFNAASWSSLGGTPYVGTRYVRVDGTGYAFLWSNTGSIYDSRTIAYGSARCGANAANSYRVFVNFCDTGNG